ncbi:hypothetical protein WJX72_003737 [[Myrmecia] bisecta]|uniref:Pyrophosphate--fructose 6-phosphate 1-phosphotransferase subunit beta n=1 Tax=[Myrmecia] bisecta TaxID=41462 RepID=A0AAW1PVY7_9CHLO
MAFTPTLPACLKGNWTVAQKEAAGLAESLRECFPRTADQPAVRLEQSDAKPSDDRRPLNVGIVLSGGQAPGGHNVIAGVLDFLQARHPGSRLFGFLNGPRGIINQSAMEITPEKMAPFRNQGGFHMIASGRDKIESAEHLQKAAHTASVMQLDGLVVCGGDDSNTNAAVLAEYFLAHDISTGVIGVPKTIDADLKNDDVPISFGFDTASKVYSEMIGNIMIDAASAGKYYHFIRLMGRNASHITLECALQTHPQAALICEEVASHEYTLSDVTEQLADMVVARSAAGKEYGVALVPEGIIEHVPEVHVLIKELNELMAASPEMAENPAAVAEKLTPASAKVFELLPASIRLELLLERDPHGNVQVARIETEKLLLRLVEAELQKRRAAGSYSGKFQGLSHYFGYEGRCSMPTNFDATYCYSLGYAAGALIASGQTGLMTSVANLERPTTDWTVGGTPFTGMMCMERRNGKLKPVIQKALVDLHGPVFKAFKQQRDKWAIVDCYRSPGPIQFSDTGAYCATQTLALEINNGKPISIH